MDRLAVAANDVQRLKQPASRKKKGIGNASF